MASQTYRKRVFDGSVEQFSYELQGHVIYWRRLTLEEHEAFKPVYDYALGHRAFEYFVDAHGQRFVLRESYFNRNPAVQHFLAQWEHSAIVVWNGWIWFVEEDNPNVGKVHDWDAEHADLEGRRAVEAKEAEDRRRLNRRRKFQRRAERAVEGK